MIRSLVAWGRSWPRWLAPACLASTIGFSFAGGPAVKPSEALADRWFRDSVVMGSWVDTSWRPPKKKKPLRKGPITWLHLGPTAECPHMIPRLLDFRCMDHWVGGTFDDEPEFGIRWDSTGWGANILLYRWVLYSIPGTDMGSDSVEGPRVVGRLEMKTPQNDTSLEVVYRGRKSILVRGPRPEAYEGNMVEPDLEQDRLDFDSLHRAHLAPVGLVVPEPVRCLLVADASRSRTDTASPDTNCLRSGVRSDEDGSVIWRDSLGGWKVERSHGHDSTGVRFHDEISFRLPLNWKWIWWERREAALRSGLTFVTGSSPHRSMAMEHPRLLFRTREGGCHISGDSQWLGEPWFQIGVSCR